MSALPRVGFIGLGRMGMPMSTKLVTAGYPVTGFDLAPEACAALATVGGTAASRPAAAIAEAEVVILMLPDSDAVHAVTNDPEDRAAIGPGLLVSVMSSSEPVRTRALAAELDALGATLIDAPVSGGVRGAEQGTLTIMVGGTRSAVAAVDDLLGHFGEVAHAGPVGAGHAIKALNNLLSATHLWVTSEAMVAGQRFGLDPEVMLSIFNGSSGRSGSTENKWPNFILSGRYDSGFGLKLMLKDMRIAVALAEQVGAVSKLGADAVALWTRAADELPATADHTEVATWIARHGE